MATDGPKIIDGDTAHDTYRGIMDIYDNNGSYEEIQEFFPIKVNYLDDFYYEIYLTSLALAYWEIGLMDEKLLSHVKQTIDKGAGVQLRTEEIDKAMGKKRHLALQNLLKKISKPNIKPRKRKKYRKVTNFHFQVDDLLSFKLSDGLYRAIICAKIEQYRGECNYYFVSTTYQDKEKPDNKNIRDYDLIGRWIGCSYDQETILSIYPGIDELRKYFPEFTNMRRGFSCKVINHKDLFTLKSNFEKTGSVEIIPAYNQYGSLSYEPTFNRFEEIFIDLEGHIKTFKESKIPVRILCKK